MLSIKIEIGFDEKHTGQKKEPDIKKAVFLAALFDSAMWIADTALLLKFFYTMPFRPFGIFFMCSVFLIYLVYFTIKTWILTKKYGKEVYRKEFGNTGILLAAVSAVILAVICLV